MKNKDKNNRAPKQGIGKIISYNLRMYSKIARTTPDFFAITVIKGLLYGFNASAEAVFTVRLFDAIDRGEPFAQVVKIIGLMALFYLGFFLFNAWHRQYLHPLLQQKLRLKLHSELFKKAQKIDLSCYDDPAYYNDFVWAMDESGRCAVDMMDDLSTVITRIVAGSALFSLLFSIDMWVAIALLAMSVLGVVISQIGNRLSFEEEKERKPLSRVRGYINRVFHLPDYAAEIRMSRVSDILMKRMDENTEKTVKLSVKYGKKYFVLYGVFDTVIQDLVYYGVLFYMFFKLIAGKILVGGFAASTGMIWRVRWQLKDLVTRLAKLPKHALFLEKYYEFLDNKPKTVSGSRSVPHFESLELRNISFRYDFSDNPKYRYGKQPEKAEEEIANALSGVDLSLKKGEKIAIVGYNGAGKTTLIKLLMRLYDPTEGQILLNGVDLKEYDLDEYRSRIGTVFQDFKIFAATVAENVMNGEYNEETDRETVLRALDAAGFSERLASMEKGVNTTLTREFDKKGTNLSGGEAQKVAIARVFAKPYELIIMDEPSSALDPLAEYELNRAILEYAADKTVIFISHRLSTTRMADRIYMFDSGALAECGTHEELMAMGGKYAEMFELQAEKYRSRA